MSADWSSYLLSDAFAAGPPSYSKSSDSSPVSDTFSYLDPADQPCIADVCNTQQDYSFDDWILSDYFNSPIPSIDGPKQPKNASTRFSSKSNVDLDVNLHASFDANLARVAPTQHAWRPDVASFNGARTANSGSLPTNCYYSSSQLSSRAGALQNPSLCVDTLHLGLPTPVSPPTPPSSSPKSSPLKRESSSSPSPEPVPKRKRGRPRLNRINTTSTFPASATSTNGTNTNTTKTRTTRRLPHNQVERKYREGLNSELERLRRAIPTLPQLDRDAQDGSQLAPKPSKATVLASAIEYIKRIEADRERLVRENERLRAGCGRRGQ